jgi:hypothetical protein
MYSSKSIIAALEREKKWILKQRDKRDPLPRDSFRRGDIVTSCVSILRHSPQTYGAWLRRKPDRERLLRNPRNWTAEKAVRAVVQLIDLTISDVEACRPFLAKRPAGCLSLKRSRQSLSAHQKRTLDQGRQQANLPTTISIDFGALASPPTNTRGSRQRRTNEPKTHVAIG